MGRLKAKFLPKSSLTYFVLAALCFLMPAWIELYHGHSGKILVASEKLHGTAFEKTIIYLDRHRLTGSRGLVLNHGIGSREFRNPFPELEWNIDLYNGGPVMYAQRQFILIPSRNPELPQPSMMSTRQLETEMPDFFETLSQSKNEEAVTLYTGYAGWGILQLNVELWGGYWYVLDYDPALIDQSTDEVMWLKALERAKKRYEVQKRLDRT